MKTISQKNKGIAYSFGVIALQGMEGFYVTLLGLFFMVGITQNSGFSAAVLGIKELIGLILTVIIFGKKVLKSVFSKIKTKESIFYILSGSLGTAVGNLFYIIAIGLAGSGYGTILTALYPVFSLLLVRIVLKKKEPIIVWVGFFISMAAALAFVGAPAIASGKSVDIKAIIGIILGAMCSLFWAFEGIFIQKGQRAGGTFKSKEIVFLRSSSSFACTFLVLMPLCALFGLFDSTNFGNSFKFLGDLFTNWKAFLVCAAIGFNIIILRLCHTKGIEYAGIKIASLIDANNFLFLPLVSIGFAAIPSLTQTGTGDPLFEVIDWWAWFLIIPIMVGVAMVLYFNKDVEVEHNLQHDSVELDGIPKKKAK